MSDNKNKSLFNLPKKFGREFEKTFNEPLAHKGDPISSYMAGDRVLKSGKFKGQVRAVYLALYRYPNITSKEFAVKADLDRYMVTRRLSVLVSCGLAERGPYRKCSICRSICRT